MIEFYCKFLFLCIIAKITAEPVSRYVCTDYYSYSSDVTRNEHCYYQPDLFTNTPELLTKYVGAYENHTLTTDDGYILLVFRIPVKNPKGVVILQHPMVTDSITWILAGNESFAYLLWQQGYEVWLPNNRGTYFSLGHTSLKHTEYEYWDFSFHEIGVYDYSTIIKHVANHTKRNDLIFIGHSMSTTASMIYAAEKPDEAKQFLKIMIEMAPTVYLRNTAWPFRFLAKYRRLIMRLLELGRVGPLFLYSSSEALALRVFVFYLPMKSIFPLLLSLVCGWTPNEMDAKLIPMLVSVNPRGTSWKMVTHYGQWMLPDSTFNWFDYGEEGNMKRYNTKTPPNYSLANISVPVFLISSKQDILTSAVDIDMLYNDLPDRVKIYGRLVISDVSHIDYQFGRFSTRYQKLYKPIFKLLKKILA